MTLFSVLSLSLLVFLSLPSPSLSEPEICNSEDKIVLLKIKAALNNPYHLASWNPETNCCDWYSVECDEITSRIISLTIFGGNISGQIPAAVGDLPYLQTLVFRKLTNLTGSIPSAITKLKHLRTITLSWTNLSGPVPSFFTELKNLTFLDLSFNDLTGSIPPELAQLTNLAAIHLDRNKLTGTIPESFGTFTGSVPDLYLSHNQLTGPVPKSLGNLDFTRLDLSRNQLSGDLSFIFGSNKTMQIVDFSRNMFEFDLSNVVFPASLISLDLNHNKSLWESACGLCGPIPTGGKLQSFDLTSYFHNRCLCGAPLPAC
ncbi:hypothetical protein HYC85_016984 [Camellia sinensis]|uniref:Leucine-rich repeat-containing N-terminal plant-type domain-containing protein n=1 Tax=Camellia sinensis TaxID=4442 RepID=A0A7J7H4S9_CAMSI|nr:hypothetical protein HYC85_016984 [Camellia sinensis]